MTTDPPAAQPRAAHTRRLTSAWAIIEPLSIGALFVFLLQASWLRWADPLVDFPRELYSAWRMSAGDLLYDRVECLYGPLPLLIEARAFRAFGPGVDTLVWLNIGVTIGVLLLIRGIFGAVGGRLVAWLCSVVFLGVFAFGQFLVIGNFNFLTPYCSQATYGLAGCLLAVWALIRHACRAQAHWLVLAGAGLGIAYLCKPEALFAAGGALAFYLAANFVHRRRESTAGGRWFMSAMGCIALGFFCVWLPIFGALAADGGFEYALRAADWVPHSIMPGAYLQTGIVSYFNQRVFGFNAPGEHFLGQLLAGGVLAVVCVAIVVGVKIWARSPQGRLQRLLALGAIAAVVAAAVVLPDWLLIGRALVFPVVLAAGYFVVRSCATRVGDFRHSLELGTIGTAAALMFARIILNGNIQYYGFFMALPGALFLVLLLAGELPIRLTPTSRARNLLAGAFALVILGGTARLGRRALAVYAEKTYPVADGRDRLYTFPPETSANGLLLNAMVAALKAHAPGTQTLLAFPESSAVNYFTRLAAPEPETAFFPTTLAMDGREKVLNDLRAHPPDAVIIYGRDTTEYGAPYFGADENSGADIVAWVRQNYRPAFAAGGPAPTTNSPTGHAFDLYLRAPDAP